MSTFIEYTKTKQFRWISSALLLVALLILPFLFKNYRVFQFNLVLVYAVAVLGLNMLTGFNGQISLGHGAFFAVGAYVAAVLMDRAAMPYWATLPFSAVVCFVVGWLMGFPALRLGGHYLALATYAFALAVPQLLKYKNIEGWTGGVQGIVLTKPEPPISFSFLGQPFSADRWLYVFTLAVAALMFLVAWNLLRGRVGRAMIAIRDHPIAATAMGINHWGRSAWPLCRPTVSPSSCRSPSWSAWWSVGWRRFPAQSSVRSSFSSSPTLPKRSPSRHLGRSTAWC